MITGVAPLFAQVGLAREHDETRGVVLLVLDVVGENLQTMNLGGQPRGDGGARHVAGLGNLARRAGGIGGDHRLDPELADDLATLAQRMDVTLDGLDAVERCAPGRHQLVAHRHEVLGHDVQAGMRHQVMNVGDPAGHRVLDRDHAERGMAGADSRECVLEGGAGHRLVLGIYFARGEMRVGPGLSLKHDLFCGGHGASLRTRRRQVNAGAPALRAPAPGPLGCRRRAARLPRC